MTDRELLEYAAKAAGFKINKERQAERDSLISPENTGLYIGSIAILWNPLIDSGDALRLAVKLEMSINHYSTTSKGNDRVAANNAPTVTYDGDPYAATRRAIVLAAAEIGKGMDNE